MIFSSIERSVLKPRLCGGGIVVNLLCFFDPHEYLLPIKAVHVRDNELLLSRVNSVSEGRALCVPKKGVISN